MARLGRRAVGVVAVLALGPPGASTCANDYSGIRPWATCDSAWEMYGVRCADLEVAFGVSCAGCSCPGDVVVSAACDETDGAAFSSVYPCQCMATACMTNQVCSAATGSCTRPRTLFISVPCEDAPNATAFEEVFTSASGAPVYSDGARYIYHDLACDGDDATGARWILDEDAPHSLADSDLDTDGACDYLGHVGSTERTGPPSGTATWKVSCDGGPEQDVLVTISAEDPSLVATSTLAAGTAAQEATTTAAGALAPSAAEPKATTATGTPAPELHAELAATTTAATLAQGTVHTTGAAAGVTHPPASPEGAEPAATTAVAALGPQDGVEPAATTTAAAAVPGAPAQTGKPAGSDAPRIMGIVSAALVVVGLVTGGLCGGTELMAARLGADTSAGKEPPPAVTSDMCVGTEDLEWDPEELDFQESTPLAAVSASMAVGTEDLERDPEEVEMKESTPLAAAVMAPL